MTLTQKEGVDGVVVCRRASGDVIRYTLADPSLARRYAALAHSLISALAAQISTIDPDVRVCFFFSPCERCVCVGV
jgi:hypothetical protein